MPLTKAQPILWDRSETSFKAICRVSNLAELEGDNAGFTLETI